MLRIDLIVVVESAEASVPTADITCFIASNEVVVLLAAVTMAVVFDIKVSKD